MKILNNWGVTVTSKDGSKVEGIAKGLTYPEMLFGLLEANIPYLSIETFDGTKKNVRVSNISSLEFKPATNAVPGN